MPTINNVPPLLYKTYAINDFRDELQKRGFPYASGDSIGIDSMLASTENLVIEGREFHSFAPVTVGGIPTAVLVFKRVEGKRDTPLIFQPTPIELKSETSGSVAPKKTRRKKNGV